MTRRFPVLLALLAITPLPVPISAQTDARPSLPVTTHSAAPATAKKPVPVAATPPAPSDQGDSQNSAQPPQIVVNPILTAPTPEWTWREQATWGSGILLAVLSYVGIMLALRSLKKIERSLEATAATAQAALESSGAALSLAQAITHSERPWIVVTVEPFLTMENSFKVMAANRGRSPARIVNAVSQVFVARDEKGLPAQPTFEATNGEPTEPIVLLPGEATGIWAFNRDELPAICKSTESLRKVERWQETLFLYGRINYSDLSATEGAETRETSWCCRYIHGEKTSALVMSGPPAYNRHS